MENIYDYFPGIKAGSGQRERDERGEKWPGRRTFWRSASFSAVVAVLKAAIASRATTTTFAFQQQHVLKAALSVVYFPVN